MFYCTGKRFLEPRHSAEGGVQRSAPARGSKAKQSKNLSSGQTLVEYVLTVALLTLIFGTVFYKMRLALFDLWVCQMAPRIQAPTGCGQNTNDCWKKLRPHDGELAQRCKIN